MKKLYEGNVRKNFFVFALPLVMAAILSQAYHIINTIMAGLVFIRCTQNFLYISNAVGLAALCVAIFYSTVLITQFKKNGVKIKGLYINKNELEFSIEFSFPTTLQQSVMRLTVCIIQ